MTHFRTIVVAALVVTLIFVAVMLSLLACRGLGSETSLSRASRSPTPVPKAPHSFPLRIETGKRYLVDATGTPFLLHADTAWSLIADLSKADAEQYLEDRRAKGFNAVIVNLLERQFATNSSDNFRNYYGDAPFASSDDYSAPNETYFAHADYIIQVAESKGLLVLLAPSYLGYNGADEGWYQAMAANSTHMRAYGRYLGARFAGHRNILWLHGGDFNPPDKSLIREIVLGIKDFDNVSLHSWHGTSETSTLRFWSGETWLDVNTIYTVKDVPGNAAEAYARLMPFLLVEGLYEDPRNSEATEQRVRLQAYQALLSGAMGHAYGNEPMWHFDGPGVSRPRTPGAWKSQLDSAGAQSMAHVKTLFSSRAWWMLVPDTTNTLLISGHVGSGPRHDKALAAKASDGSFALVYMPSMRAVTVDLSQMSGPRVMARWFDPASGLFSSTALCGSPFHSFLGRLVLPLPPGNNSSATGEYSDWVLVIESVS